MEGMGQHAGLFASPADAWGGVETWQQMSGIGTDNPFVTGPGVGGSDLAAGAAATAGTTGLVHIATGQPSAEVTGVQHWSEMLNIRDSPLPYLLVLLLLFMGAIHVEAAARVGR
jgi:hypothetical protein